MSLYILVVVVFAILFGFLFPYSKMKKKYHPFGTIAQSNIKIVERAKLMPITHKNI